MAVLATDVLVMVFVTAVAMIKIIIPMTLTLMRMMTAAATKTTMTMMMMMTMMMIIKNEADFIHGVTVATAKIRFDLDSDFLPHPPLPHLLEITIPVGRALNTNNYPLPPSVCVSQVGTEQSDPPVPDSPVLVNVSYTSAAVELEPVVLREGLAPSYRIMVDRQNSSGTVRTKRQAVQVCVVCVCVCVGGGEVEGRKKRVRGRRG